MFSSGNRFVCFHCHLPTPAYFINKKIKTTIMQTAQECLLLTLFLGLGCGCPASCRPRSRWLGCGVPARAGLGSTEQAPGTAPQAGDAIYTVLPASPCSQASARCWPGAPNLPQSLLSRCFPTHVPVLGPALPVWCGLGTCRLNTAVGRPCAEFRLFPSLLSAPYPVADQLNSR